MSSEIFEKNNFDEISEECKKETEKQINAYESYMINGIDGFDDVTYIIDIASDYDRPMLMSKFAKVCGVNSQCDFWQNLYEKTNEILLSKFDDSKLTKYSYGYIAFGIPHPKVLQMFCTIFLDLISVEQTFNEILIARKNTHYTDSSLNF